VSLGFHRLKTLHLLTPSFVHDPSRHLGALSRLQSLEELGLFILPVSSDSLAAVPSQTSIPFPSLRSLLLEAGGPREVTRIMSCLCNLENMTVLTANMDHDIENSDDVSDLVRVLAGVLPQNMRSIDIRHYSTEGPGPFRMSLIVFQRLYQFKALRELRFDLVSLPRMDDAAIEELAHAFPHLEQLSLCPKAPYFRPSNVTLAGLSTLMRNCPQLRSVAMIVDCTVAANVMFSSSPSPAPESHVDKLDLGDSPIDDPEFTAQHLSRMFPRLSSIVTYRLDESTDDISDDWFMVESIIRGIHASRSS